MLLLSFREFTEVGLPAILATAFQPFNS